MCCLDARRPPSISLDLGSYPKIFVWPIQKPNDSVFGQHTDPHKTKAIWTPDTLGLSLVAKRVPLYAVHTHNKKKKKKKKKKCWIETEETVLFLKVDYCWIETEETVLFLKVDYFTIPLVPRSRLRQRLHDQRTPIRLGYRFPTKVVVFVVTMNASSARGPHATKSD